MRRTIVFLLLFCLFAAGCSGSSGDEKASSGAGMTEAQSSELPTADTISLLDGEGKPLYRLVRPDRASDMIRDAGVELRLTLNRLAGLEFEITSDFLNKNKNESADGIYEILLGDTNRAESAAAAAGLGFYEYVICVMGEKIVIAGGSDYAAARAAAEFPALLKGEHLSLAPDMRIFGSAETGAYLVGITNQGESKIEVYDISTRAINEKTLLFSVDMPYFNIAGLKLRVHEEWGDVVISACGSNYASIVAYPEGKTLWSTHSAANNPHSVELIPGNIFVVASSTGGALRFFDLGGNPNKYLEIAYPDAHGVLWDPENQILWALGSNMLKAYTVGRSGSGEIVAEEVAERNSVVPTAGGHDLAPVYGDKNQLWITSNSMVYKYDKAKKSFATNFPGSDIIKKKGVKGVGNFPDGSIVLVNPDGVFRTWTTATVDFYLASGEKYTHIAAQSATGHFYKCRVWCSDYQ